MSNKSILALAAGLLVGGGIAAALYHWRMASDASVTEVAASPAAGTVVYK